MLKKKKYIYFLYYHIPTFFIISFYFNYKTLISFNIEKIELRFQRLIIPYMSWCFISWIIKNIYFLSLEMYIVKFKYLLIILMNGHIYNVVLWFQNILIILTIIFTIVIFSFKKKYLLIFFIISILSYILLYSGFNYYFFIHKYDYRTATTYGRLVEVFPFALTGFYFAKIDSIKFLLKYRKKAILFNFAILIIITKYKIFADIKNFKYGGLRLNIAAINIFIIFSLFPCEIIKSETFFKIIIQISNYTGGIYFTHYLIGRGKICQKILPIKKHTFFGCIITYLISYIICFIGIKVFGKTKFKHLFA